MALAAPFLLVLCRFLPQRSGGFKTSPTPYIQKTHTPLPPIFLPTGPATGQRPPAPTPSHILAFQVSEPGPSSPSVSLIQGVLITGVPCLHQVPSVYSTPGFRVVVAVYQPPQAQLTISGKRGGKSRGDPECLARFGVSAPRILFYQGEFIQVINCSAAVLQWGGDDRSPKGCRRPWGRGSPC